MYEYTKWSAIIVLNKNLTLLSLLIVLVYWFILMCLKISNILNKLLIYNNPKFTLEI